MVLKCRVAKYYFTTSAIFFATNIGQPSPDVKHPRKGKKRKIFYLLPPFSSSSVFAALSKDYVEREREKKERKESPLAAVSLLVEFGMERGGRKREEEDSPPLSWPGGRGGGRN